MNWVCNFNANNKSVHFLGCDIIDDGQDGSDTQDIETLNDSDRLHTEIQEPPIPQISPTDLGIHCIGFYN